MNEEEIKHFKALLRQGSLRHMNILLDDKFQKELLSIIKDYEKLQQENKALKDRVAKAIEYIEENGHGYDISGDGYYCLDEEEQKELIEILKGDKK